MIRSFSICVAAWLALAPSRPARGHELWFQPSGGSAAAVRLTFADSPAPGEAERVAEIAHAKVWGDGRDLDVDRRPDGLEAHLPPRRPALLSAFADRGVVDYQGDSFVIPLAAYAQAGPVPASRAGEDGLDADQVRLLLVRDGSAPPVVRARWRGKPAADAAVTIFRAGAEPAQARTDARGEVPCPDLSAGPVSILAVVLDRTPGRRDGRPYSHTRYKATLLIDPQAEVEACIARVREIHGGAGPWAVVGYRMGERALRDLDLAPQSFALSVVHRCPSQVQYSCMADGLQAATGASPGKLNLAIQEAPVEALASIVEDRKAGRTLTFTIKPELAKAIRDLPLDRLEAEGRRVAALPDDQIFEVVESSSRK